MTLVEYVKKCIIHVPTNVLYLPECSFRQDTPQLFEWFFNPKPGCKIWARAAITSQVQVLKKCPLRFRLSSLTVVSSFFSLLYIHSKSGYERDIIWSCVVAEKNVFISFRMSLLCSNSSEAHIYIYSGSPEIRSPSGPRKKL